MAQFQIRTSTDSGPVVVSLSGEADLAVRDELTEVLLAAVTSAPVVVVDLGDLTFIDSSGIHGLLTAYHATQRDGTRMYAVNATGLVADLLDVTGLAELLQPPSPDGGPDV